MSPKRIARGGAVVGGIAAAVSAGLPALSAHAIPATTCPGSPNAVYCLSGNELSGTGNGMSPGWYASAISNPGGSLKWDLYSQTYSDGGVVAGRVKSGRNRDLTNGATLCLYYGDTPQTSFFVADVKWSFVGWKNIKNASPSYWDDINTAGRNPGGYPAAQGNCPASPYNL